MIMLGPPAKGPCSTCPYKKSTPSGVWDEKEYLRLPEYDGPTGEQSKKIFACHRVDGRVCAGWVGCHDMRESLSVRVALATRTITIATFDKILAYESPVPLWGSGAEASAYGLRDLQNPSPRAIQLARKLLERIREVRGAVHPRTSGDAEAIPD